MRNAYGSTSRSDLIPKEVSGILDVLSTLQCPFFNKPRIMPRKTLQDNGFRGNSRDECPVMKGLRPWRIGGFLCRMSRDECPVMKGLRRLNCEKANVLLRRDECPVMKGLRFPPKSE